VATLLARSPEWEECEDVTQTRRNEDNIKMHTLALWGDCSGGGGINGIEIPQDLTARTEFTTELLSSSSSSSYLVTGFLSSLVLLPLSQCEPHHSGFKSQLVALSL
jgi:hypothetical protein